jgi:tetratricopeptide (TPR) repeat protein
MIKDKSFQSILRAGDINAGKQYVKNLKGFPAWKVNCYWAAFYVALNDLAKAEQYLQRALLGGRDEYLPQFLYAQFLLKIGEGSRSLQFSRRAAEINPESLECMLLLLQTLMDNARTEEALALIKRLPKEKRESKGVIFAQASALRSEGYHSDALKIIQQYRNQSPNDLTAMRLEADIVADKDSQLGVQYYQKAIDLDSKKRRDPDPALKWNSALHFLRTRDFKNGWDNWEFGFSPKVGTLGRKVPPQLKRLDRVSFDQEMKNHAEKWLIVVPEQGVGDQVLFLSGLRQLVEEHPRIILVSDHRMYPILKRSFPTLTIAYPGIIDDWNYLALPSLGYFPYGSIFPRFRPSVEAFTQYKAPFFIPNKKNSSQIRAMLESRSHGRRLIGISWKGGFWTAQKRNKSIDSNSFFKSLSKGYSYVNLQYGDTSSERELAKEMGLNLISFEGIDFTTNLDFWNDIISAVDQVVSISTAVVHFAGAMGKRVDILLPESQGPWILGLDDHEHIAYRNVYIHRSVSERNLPKILEGICHADL